MANVPTIKNEFMGNDPRTDDEPHRDSEPMEILEIKNEVDIGQFEENSYASTSHQMMLYHQNKEVSEIESNPTRHKPPTFLRTVDTQCAVCQKEFFTRPEFIEHARIEHPNAKAFKCGECSMVFINIHSVSRHRSRIHKETQKKHVCEFCSKTFLHLDSFKRHLVTHTTGRSYSCSYCEKSYKFKDSWINHEKTHFQDTFSEGDKDLNVIDKNNTRSNKGNDNDESDDNNEVNEVNVNLKVSNKIIENEELNQEALDINKSNDLIKMDNAVDENSLQVNNGEEIYKVEYIEDKTDALQDNSNTQELNYEYNKIPRYKPMLAVDRECAVCHKEFFTRSEFIEHARIEHPNAKAFKCGECSMFFTNIHSISRHRRIHKETQKKHVCEFCSKTFLHQDSFKRHLVSHTTGSSYSCSYCEKSYKFKDSWLNHEKTHFQKDTFLEGDQDLNVTDKNNARSNKGNDNGKNDNNNEEKMTVNVSNKNIESELLNTFLQDTLEIDNFNGLIKIESAVDENILQIDNSGEIYNIEYIEDNTDGLQDNFNTQELNDESNNFPRYKPILAVDRECGVCHKEFFTRSEFIEHARLEHPNAKAFKCGQCSMLFTNIHSVSRHRRNHKENQKRHICEFCSKTFLHKDSFKRHLVSHTTGRSYSCSYCEKSYKHKDTWINHEKTHLQKDTFSQGDKDLNLIVQNNTESKKSNDNDKNNDDIHLRASNKNIENEELNTFLQDALKIDSLIKVENADDENILQVNHSGEIYKIADVADNSNTQELNDEFNKVTRYKPMLAVDRECGVCHKEFNFRNDLVRHAKQYHANGKAFKCNICLMRFANINSVARHRLTHKNVPKQHICPKCPKSFWHKDDFNRHLMRVHSMKPYTNNQPAVDRKCAVCNEEFKRRLDLIEHAKQFHPNSKAFKCNVCSMVFTNIHYISRHRRIHKNMPPSIKYVCQICSKTFLHQTSYTRHLKTHTERPSYSCSLCDKSYIVKKSWEKHQKIHLKKASNRSGNNSIPKSIQIRTVAENPESVVPKYENKENSPLKQISKTSVENLKLKIKRQSVKFKPAVEKKCAVCLKEFNLRSELEKHTQQYHPKSKAFKCSYCSKLFTNIVSVSIHNRIHKVSQKRYVCEICSKSFIRRDYLKSHYDTHAKGRYCCSICKKTYECKNELTLHQKSHLKLPILKFFKNNSDDEEEEDDNMTLQKIKENLILKRREKQLNREEKPIKIEADEFNDNLNTNFDKVVKGGQTKSKMKRPLTTRLAVDLNCAVCHKKFMYRQDLIEHAKQFHPNKKSFKCNLCPMLFVNIHSIARHRRSHNNYPKKHFCSFCNKYFMHQDDFKRHLNVHAKNRFFNGRPAVDRKCAVCQKKFIYRQDLIEHAKEFHPNDKAFKCTICSMVFTNIHYISRHRRTHKNLPRKYVCEYCNASFIHIDNFRRHLQSNRHQESLKGHQIKQDSFDEHKNVANLPKKYFCEICSISITTKLTYNRHLQTNNHKNKVNIYQLKHGLEDSNKKWTNSPISIFCKFCSTSFTHSDSYKRHLKSKKHEDNLMFYQMQLVTLDGNKDYLENEETTNLNDQNIEEEPTNLNNLNIEEKLNGGNDIQNDFDIKNLLEISKTEYVFNEIIIDAAKIVNNDSTENYSVNENAIFEDGYISESASISKQTSEVVIESPSCSKHISKDLAKKYFCEICFQSCVSKTHLKRHLSKHTKKRPYVCSICKRSYKRKDDMRTHQRRIHWNKKLLMRRKYSSDKQVENNTSDVEEINNLEIKRILKYVAYTCPFCEKSFKSQKRLRSHKNRFHLNPIDIDMNINHSPQKQDSLEEEQQVFFQDTNFQNHVNNSGKEETAIDNEKEIENFLFYINDKDITTNKKIEYQVNEEEICLDNKSKKELEIENILEISKTENVYNEAFIVDAAKSVENNFTKNASPTCSGKQTSADLSKKFVCEICFQSCVSKCHLKRHLSTHSTERPYPCSFCKKTYKRKDDKMTHQRRVHGNEQLLSKFNNTNNEIIDAKEAKKGKHFCELCCKSFPSKTHLNRHLSKHSNERPYACSFCGKYLKCKESLKTHKTRFHSNQLQQGKDSLGIATIAAGQIEDNLTAIKSPKIHNSLQNEPFSLEYNIKEATNFQNERLQTVEEDEPTENSNSHGSIGDNDEIIKPVFHKNPKDNRFHCKFCSKSFNFKTQLHRHMSTHTYERPYNCSFCKKSYKRKDDMRTHERRNHMEEIVRLNDDHKTRLKFNQLQQVNNDDEFFSLTPADYANANNYNSYDPTLMQNLEDEMNHLQNPDFMQNSLRKEYEVELPNFSNFQNITNIQEPLISCVELKKEPNQEITQDFL